MDGLDPDVVDLQLRFMRLERELAELSAIVAEHQQTIDTLKLEARRQRDQATLEEPSIENAPPPHY
jgi:uncharacterized coiled-coil protein SlyX